MRKMRLPIFVLLISVCTLSFAQSASIQKDVVYGHLDGMAMVYDVVKPQGPNGLGIIIVVSGGWHSGPENLALVTPFYDVLLSEGYTLFQLYHPSMPTYVVPDAYKGVKLGLNHIFENAETFGVDPDRLGISGVSSGGHLALLLAMDNEERGANEHRLATVVAFMPPVDLRGQAGNVRATPALDFDAALEPELSPVDYASADDSPVLFIHGSNDQVVPYEENSVRLEALLRAANVPTQLFTVNAGHEVFPEPEMVKAHEVMLSWFEEHL